ncbi:unnamed protein product [Rangifer tarandus platyrhynchus]|uniref:Uncharacterized protein n=2 Tax=Rangifer tarandus platyrhynchus TaxID=3082113 RepID=A0AC59YZW9_RANTA|nr:unnamed protein product [Rangifer tarandus platyrhynchus]
MTSLGCDRVGGERRDEKTEAPRWDFQRPGFPSPPTPILQPLPPLLSSTVCGSSTGSPATARWDSRGTPPSGQPPALGAAPPRRRALAGEPATEGGGGERATEAGRGVGESSRAVYGLSEAADL